MLNAVTEVVAAGFVAGAVSGTVVLFAMWSITAAMNLIKSATKGDDEA
ncbi:MAG: hypothetical protein FWC70_13175 [Defluviitaleaceae bacterium]|nr:hypothetical protein [Defluviitaleaceae bacterium]